MIASKHAIKFQFSCILNVTLNRLKNQHQKMLNKNLVLVFVILTIQSASSAMRKSWKSSANFESKIPKFTPFENSVLDVETEELPITSIKISSKIKAHEKHVANLYNNIKDSQKVSQDFGSFAYHVPETSSEEEELDNELPSKLLNSDDDDEEFNLVSNDDGTEFKVGQLMNVSVNSNEDTVNINLDHKSLKEIFTGNKRGKFLLSILTASGKLIL